MKKRTRTIVGLILILSAVALMFFWELSGREQMGSIPLLVADRNLMAGELAVESMFAERRAAAEDQVHGALKPEEVDKIYLNFSDPWPKARHAKRRLTSKQFFERYDKILAFDGVVEFKTDNRELFDFSLEQVELAGWVLLAKTYDLHNDPTLSRGNVMTEYEEKFSGQGHPIHKLIAMRQ